jgi:hypothetical protein
MVVNDTIDVSRVCFNVFSNSNKTLEKIKWEIQMIIGFNMKEKVNVIEEGNGIPSLACNKHFRYKQIFMHFSMIQVVGMPFSNLKSIMLHTKIDPTPHVRPTYF